MFGFGITSLGAQLARIKTGPKDPGQQDQARSVAEAVTRAKRKRTAIIANKGAMGGSITTAGLGSILSGLGGKSILG